MDGATLRILLLELSESDSEGYVRVNERLGFSLLPLGRRFELRLDPAALVPP